MLRLPSRSVLCPILLLLLMPLSTAMAGAAEIAAGALVVARRDAALKTGDRVTGRVRAGESVVVRRVQGEWLWTDDGWILAADVEETPAGYIRQAVSLIQQSELEQALAYLDRACALDPDNYDAHAARSVGWTRLGKYDRAVRDANRAIEIDPERVEAYATRSELWVKQSDYEAARRDLGLALELDPRQMQLYIRRAWVWMELADPELALADAERAIELAPDYHGGYEVRSAARRLMGEYDRAIFSADLAVEKLKTRRELGRLDSAYIIRGWTLLELGEFEKALADCREALARNPKSFRAYELRSQIWLRIGDYRKALADCESMQRLYPHDAAPYLATAKVWLDQAEYDRAIAECDRALELDPRDSTAYAARAFALIGNGLFAPAVTDCNRSLELADKRGEVVSIRGLAHFKSGNLAQAAADYARAIELNEYDAATFSRRGDLAYEQQRYLEALKDYSHAIRLDPREIRANPIDGNLHFKRSRVYAAVGSLPLAMRDLSTANVLAPQKLPADAQQEIRVLALGAKPVEIKDGSQRVALLVGVNRYQKRQLAEQPLSYAERDVELLAHELRQQGFHVVTLTGSDQGPAQATRANIERAISELLTDRQASDIVLIGLAGHGLQRPFEGREDAFYCPVDAVPEDRDTLISLTDLMVRLDRQGGVNLVLVDACRNDPTRSIVGNRLMGRLPSNTAIMFSCAARQQAFETEKAGGGHGVFFYHVIEALRGKAANQDGDVTWDELVTYCRSNVNRQAIAWFPSRAEAAGGVLQTPHEIRNLVAFPILAKSNHSTVRSQP